MLIHTCRIRKLLTPESFCEQIRTTGMLLRTKADHLGLNLLSPSLLLSRGSLVSMMKL